MEIKEIKQGNFFWQKVKESFKKKSRVKWIILAAVSIILLAAIVLSSMYYGISLYLNGKALSIRDIMEGCIHNKIAIVPNYIKGLLSTPERIVIDIQYEDYQKLAYKRELALERGYLSASSDDFVSADIRYNNEVIKVKIRLKGDGPDNWVHQNKWAFRVNIRNDNTIFGMEEFSIQPPVRTNYLDEWFFNKILQYSDLISLRYDFIHVTLNGKRLGIYAIEEHFEKRLIENNQYREGAILKFNDRSFWDNTAAITKKEFDSSVEIDSFGMNTMKQDDKLLAQFNQAKNLLESFRRGDLMAYQVFDIDKLAKFFAIVDLFGSGHAFSFPNLRFYYNPVTSLLEPIGYDNEFIMPLEKNFQNMQLPFLMFNNSNDVNFETNYFKDQKFFEKYIQALKQVSNKEWFDELFNEIDQEYKTKLHILYRDFPWYWFKGKSIIYKNQEYIKNVLNPKYIVQSYYKDFNEEENLLELEIGNIHTLPVEVVGIKYKENIIFKPKEKIILASKVLFDPIKFQNVTFLIPENLEWSKSIIDELKLEYKILGLDEVKTTYILPWSHLDDDFFENDFMREKPNWQQFDFIKTDWQNKIISIKSGNWEINKNLIIPKDFNVICEEDTYLNLSNSAKILSYSPIQFLGTEDSPIIVESRDSTGQGLIIINSGEGSKLEHVFFRNLSAPKQGDWELTGAVNFYESPVDISHCQFESNRECDDYLNIIRSEFTIDKSLFTKTFADAIDLDFSKGRITDTSFVSCGEENKNGDAIDLSGSIVEMDNIFINGAGDKGLSIGENSYVSINQIEIKNSRITIASKDMSEVNIENINISDSEIGLAVFQKKSEFGSAKMNINLLKEKNIDKLYLLEKGSSLIIDGSNIESNADSVFEILYGDN